MYRLSKLINISENIFIYPFGEEGVQANVGIIIADDKCILIDSGNSPQQANLIKKELVKIEAPPVKYIIYTHHHWDHTFGSDAFNDCEVIAHERTYKYLKQMQEINWSKEYLLREIENDPSMKFSHESKLKAINDWDTFNIVLPNITFTDRMTLNINKVTLELSFIGGQHADDSILIKELESNILFVGDCFYPKSTDGSTSIDILKLLQKESAKVYIHGHGAPAKHEELEAFIMQIEK